jgi:hypothetical protein
MVSEKFFQAAGLAAALTLSAKPAAAEDLTGILTVANEKASQVETEILAIPAWDLCRSIPEEAVTRKDGIVATLTCFDSAGTSVSRTCKTGSWGIVDCVESPKP